MPFAETRKHGFAQSQKWDGASSMRVREAKTWQAISSAHTMPSNSCSGRLQVRKPTSSGTPRSCPSAECRKGGVSKCHAHRHGGHGYPSRRRPGPAAGDGGGAECETEGAVFASLQQNQEHFPLQHAQGQGLQRADVRRRERPSGNLHARRARQQNPCGKQPLQAHRQQPVGVHRPQQEYRGWQQPPRGDRRQHDADGRAERAAKGRDGGDAGAARERRET